MTDYKKYKIDAHLPSGMCCPYYNGYVEVYAKDEENAIKKAKKKIWQTHPNRKIVIDKIQIIYT